VLGRSASAITAILLFAPATARAQVELRGSAAAVIPVAAPQTQLFGPGAGLSMAVAARPLPWLSLGGAIELSMLSLVNPQLPEGVLAPTAPGGWVALAALARIEPLAPPARVSPFLELSVAAGFTGTRFAPAITPRAGLVVRFAPFSVGASVGYWRLFDVLPSVLPGDGQFVTAGLELSRSFGAPAERRAERNEPRRRVAQQMQAPRCRTHVHSLASDLDHDGCPDADTDNDRISDPVDRCVNDPEDYDNFEDTDGCPDPDNDRDTIPDTADRCPLVPEVINGISDEDGCPDESLARVLDGRIQYVDQLRFFFNSIRITPESQPVLRDIARIFNAHPEFNIVFIEGHADSIGDEHYNFRLSLLRARAIIDALARYGVPRARFVPIGYGQRQPVAYGEDYWRRALNRRVEFVLDGRRTPGRAFTPRGYIDVRPGVTP